MERPENKEELKNIVHRKDTITCEQSTSQERPKIVFSICMYWGSVFMNNWKKKKLHENAFIIDTGQHYCSVYMYGYILFAY